MEPIGTTSIKEKLTRSRSLWLGAANEKFLQRLYNVLDDPNNHHIICWSEDGRLIIIKDEKQIATKITRFFECCSTLLNFCQRLEDCLFAEVFNKQFPRGNAYEHLYLTRDKRPVLKIMKEAGQAQKSVKFEGANKNNQSGYEPPLKKAAKKESQGKNTNSNSLHSDTEESGHTAEPFPSFLMMVSDFYVNIRSQDRKKKHMKSILLGMTLMENLCPKEEIGVAGFDV